jgi:hypothetical protein
VNWELGIGIGIIGNGTQNDSSGNGKGLKINETTKNKENVNWGKKDECEVFNIHIGT